MVFKTLGQKLLFVILVLFIVLSILVVVCMQALGEVYAGLLLDETGDKLQLYTSTVEKNLIEIQQFANDILSNYSMQNDMRTYISDPASYEAHAASSNLYNQLFAVTANRSYISSSYFTFINGHQLTLLTGRGERPDADFLRKAHQSAQDARGRGIWMIDPENPNIIVFAKTINSVYPSESFSQFGVLVFCLNTEKLLVYPQAQQIKQISRLFCFVNGILFTFDPVPPEAETIQALFAKTGEAGGITPRFRYKRIDSSVAGWSFVHMYDAGSLLEQIRTVRIRYFLFFVAVAACVIFVIMRITANVCRPLVRIAGRMMRVQDGFYDELPQADAKSPEEIQILTDSYNTMISKIDYLINDVYEKQLTISSIRYAMLQNQINPHFLYNTLETIHWKALNCGDADISAMVLSLSALLRASVKLPDIITLEEELKLLDDYITIQSIRFEQRLSFKIENTEPFLRRSIPKMTIQPLVENCIRHVLEKRAGICRIQIICDASESGIFIIQVCDNGTEADIGHIVGCIDGSVGARGSGLNNIQRRLQICFGKKAGLSARALFSESGQRRGTCVSAHFPS